MTEDRVSVELTSETRQQLWDDDERSSAVVQAEAGARAWLAVVGAQQDATPDHADFSLLAGCLVDTLAAVESLARVLGRQVEGYPGGLDAGRVVSDDRGRDPHQRLVGAARDLDAAALYAGSAAREVHRFFSAIEHIGVHDTPTDPDPDPDAAGDPASPRAQEGAVRLILSSQPGGHIRHDTPAGLLPHHHEPTAEETPLMNARRVTAALIGTVAAVLIAACDTAGTVETSRPAVAEPSETTAPARAASVTAPSLAECFDTALATGVRCVVTDGPARGAEVEPS